MTQSANAPVVVEVEGDTTGLEDSVDKSATKAGEGFKKKFGKYAKAAGIATGAILGAALVSGLNTEDATVKLQHQLGLTAEESKRIGGVAGSLYAQGYGESADEINGAVQAIIQQMGGMRDASAADLQAITKDALNFSSTFGTDTAESIKGVQALLKTGLAKDANDAFNILTKGFQNGANKADDLFDTFNEYSVQFQKLGLDGKDALGLISQGLSAGARDSDIVADSLKEFSLRAVTGLKGAANYSAPVEQAFESIGLNAGEMAKAISQGGPQAKAALGQTLTALKAIKDPIAQNAAATALFGTQAEDLGKSLFALDLDTAAKGLGDIDKAANGLDTVSTKQQLEIVKREVFGLVTSIGTALMPVIHALGNFLGGTVVPILQSVSTWLRNNGAVILPLVAALGAALGVWKAIALATVAWAKAQLLLNAVQTASPMKLIIVAVVALGAALVLAYKKSETFRNILQAVWNGIKTVVSAVWNGVLKPIFNAFVAVLKAVGSAATTLWHVIQTVAHGIGVAFHAVGSAIAAVWAGIKKVFGFISDAWHAVGHVIGVTKDVIRRAFLAVGHAIKVVYDNTIGPIIDKIKDGLNALKDLAGEAEGIGNNVLGALGGGSATGKTGKNQSFDNSAFGKAAGGRVQEGRSYVVGDKYGPEIFTPWEDGYITPHNQIAGDTDNRQILVQQNYYGPTSSAGRRRELEWTLKYATR